MAPKETFDGQDVGANAVVEWDVDVEIDPATGRITLRPDGSGPGGGAVDSVNGQTGDVTITAAGIGAATTGALATEASTRQTADTTEASARATGDANTAAAAAADATSKANAAIATAAADATAKADAAKARAAHSGTQAISTVSGLQAALDAKETPAGATAKALAAVNDRIVLWDPDTRTWAARGVTTYPKTFDSKEDATAFAPDDPDMIPGDVWDLFPYPDPDQLVQAFNGTYWALVPGPPATPPPTPTPFPVNLTNGVPAIVYTQAEIDAWTTGSEYSRLAGGATYGAATRTCYNPGTQIALANVESGQVRNDSVWAKCQAVLWAIDGNATRKASVEAYLDGYNTVTSWEVNTNNQTQRLNAAWTIINQVQAAAIIGYSDAGFDAYLLASWNPTNVAQSGNTVLDWTKNPNWQAAFAAAQLAIAAWLGDSVLWVRARSYFRKRLAQSIWHPTYDTAGTVKPQTNDSGVVSTTNTVAHWGGEWNVPQVAAPGLSGAHLPTGTNAERLRDHGHVCMSYGSWVQCARIIEAQNETLSAEEYARIKDGINYHASRVLPWFQDGTMVEPWPWGNNDVKGVGPNSIKGAGTTDINQSWFPAKKYLGADASADLIAICLEDEVTGYAANGANHMVAEKLTDG